VHCSQLNTLKHRPSQQTVRHQFKSCKPSPIKADTQPRTPVSPAPGPRASQATSIAEVVMRPSALQLPALRGLIRLMPLLLVAASLMVASKAIAASGGLPEGASAAMSAGVPVAC
jgi:hypothetical protein